MTRNIKNKGMITLIKKLDPIERYTFYPSSILRWNIYQYILKTLVKKDHQYAFLLEYEIFKYACDISNAGIHDDHGENYRKRACAMIRNFELNGEFLYTNFEPTVVIHLSNFVLRYNTHREKMNIDIKQDFDTERKILEDGMFHVDQLQEGGLLKCSKCKSRQVKTELRQLRSADEGMTVFATCMNCNKKWTM